MNIPGTGLGLHIVSKYIELMGGTISVASEIENGTTFTIKFNL
jgi:signal transduction histidine kinase